MKIGENVCVIATYEKLANMYRNVLKEYKLDIDVKILDNYYGNDINDISKVLADLAKYANEGKEIVITRGFLAHKIPQYFDFRVIEINISANDVLCVLKKYIGKDVLLGVVECEQYISVVKSVAENLGIRVKEYKVENMDDFGKGIRRAKEEGVDVVVGGAYSLYDATGVKKHDIVYENIESTEESIRASLKNYLEMYELFYEERVHKELLQTIADFSAGGMLAVSNQGIIMTINAYTAELLGKRRDELVGSDIAVTNVPVDIRTVVETAVASIGNVCEWNDNRVILSVVPMIVDDITEGAVLTVKKADDVRADEKRIRKELIKKGLSAKQTFDDIKGKSKLICDLKKRAELYGKTEATILITGESGTGKEVFAQAIHNSSRRKNNPFVAINCSSLSKSLLESEIFGYEEGAFTGAKKGGKPGVFELAHGGTIFLDEIGDIDLGMQALLLRTVQEKEIMRIGDDKVIQVDVRILTATNKNLYEEVQQGRFREDLYYRLNILEIEIPPLRIRKEDIEALANNYIKKLNEKYNYYISGIDKDVLYELMKYDWPGNIRELNNTIEKMVVVVQSGVIVMDKVEFLFEATRRLAKKTINRKINCDEQEKPFTLYEMEKNMITRAMKENHNNKTKAAQQLGINRTTLIRKLGIYECREE